MFVVYTDSRGFHLQCTGHPSLQSFSPRIHKASLGSEWLMTLPSGYIIHKLFTNLTKKAQFFVVLQMPSKLKYDEKQKEIQQKRLRSPVNPIRCAVHGNFNKTESDSNNFDDFKNKQYTSILIYYVINLSKHFQTVSFAFRSHDQNSTPEDKKSWMYNLIHFCWHNCELKTINLLRHVV